MTGPLVLAANPTANLHPATKQYVDGAIAGLPTAADISAVGAGGGGLLRYVSATALSYLPFNGSRIKINGQLIALPAGGVAGLGNTGVFVNGVAGQNLAPSTLYYVYAFMSGGVPTADYSTTGHATSIAAFNLGTEIKTGDDTRSLIGMVYTNVSSQFGNTEKFRCVRSWFNRWAEARNFAVTYLGQTSTNATVPVELSGVWRFELLNWAGESAHFDLMMTCWNIAMAGYTTFAQVYSFTVPDQNAMYTLQRMSIATDYGGNWQPNNYSQAALLVEGWHMFSLCVWVNGGGVNIGRPPAPFVSITGHLA